MEIRDKIDLVAIEKLVPYARNSRTHSDAQVAQIAASMREWGWTNPVLVDEHGGIIAGHGRVLAARQLGLAEVPVIVARGWSEAQKRAYVISDNKLALNAEWDEDMLRAELLDLKGFDYDIGLLGFNTDFMADLMADPPLAKDPNAAPQVPETSVSVLGDVWILGQHRLVCGDSTSPTNMQALMRGDMADACWTDPPYNVAYGEKAEFLNNGGNPNKRRNTSRILNDDMDDASFKEFLAGFYRAAWGVMKPGAAIYVAHSETERHNFTEQMLTNGFKLSGCVIWKKNTMVLGRSDYQWIHEPILYGWKKGAAHKWFGGRKKTTVVQLGDASPFVQRADGRWEINLGMSIFVVDGNAEVEELLPSIVIEDKPVRNDVHPTMKPVALIERMLANSAKRGAVVLDPFGGSGSTLIACERLGMKARLSELSPGYVDVIVRRWQEFTGGGAVLEGDGRTFNEIADTGR